MDITNDAYDTVFSEPRFLSACVRVLGAFPKTARALTVAKVLHEGTNYSPFSTSLARHVTDVDAFQCMLKALSSTVHDDETMLHLISAVGNCCDVQAGDWLPKVRVCGRVVVS